MRAVTFSRGRISIERHPDPDPGTREVLVAVHAAGLNGADMFQRDGLYPAPPGFPQDIPGIELAGEVVACGPHARRFSLGDRVMGIIGGGGQAELAAVDERILMPVPEALTWGEAGGAPEAFTTAYDAVFRQAELIMGERLLVHGGAGGVGSAAIQLGVAAGADVIATVRNASLRSRVEELGATVVAPEVFPAHGPFDVILELVGAVNVEADLASLATGGRLAVVGVGAGSRAEVDFGLLMMKRARIHGSTLRARPPEQKAEAVRAVERSVLPLLASGRAIVPLAETFPLDAAEDAYERFAGGGKLGKIVLIMPVAGSRP